MTGTAPGLRQPLPGLPRPTRPTRQAEPAVAPPLVPNVAPQFAPHLPPQLPPHLAPRLPPHLAPRLPPHLAPQLPPLVPPQGALQSPSPSAAPATPPDTPPKTPRATPATPPTTPSTPSPAAWRKHWRPARWLAIARLSAQALNLPLGLALIALLLAAGLALVATPRWRAEQTAADQAARRLARAPRIAAPAAASATGDEQRLLSALPDADSSPQRVADLLALAAQHGLVVHSTRQVLPAATATAAISAAVTAVTSSATNATNAAAATAAATTATAATATAAVSSPAASATAWAMAPLRLSMGVQGGYSSLRQFVADALHDDALLLDQLRLARPSAQARELTADLQWLLLQREQRPERPERPARPARADSNGPAAAAAQPGRQR